MRAPDRQNVSRTLLTAFAVGAMAIALTPVLRAQPPIANSPRTNSPGTTIELRGSALLPAASGVATLKRNQGITDIHAEFDRLPPPDTFGQRYATYVMWAVTPIGDAVHLGEVMVNDTHGTLDATTDLESFALLVTAEPDAAATQPGDAVVLVSLFNEKRPATTSAIPDTLPEATFDAGVPLEIQEAHTAIEMARTAGAETYAPNPFQQAVRNLDQAEVYLRDPDKRDAAITLANEAAQGANDARLIADSSKQEAEYEAERQRIEDELERVKSEIAEAQNAEPAAGLQPERQEVARAENQAQDAQAAEALAASRLANERAQAARNLETAQADDSILQREATIAEPAPAELDPTALRAQIRQELGSALVTRETENSLIAAVPEDAFYVNAASLKQETRDMLARLVGVLLAYPDLKLDVRTEGPEAGQSAGSYTELHQQNLLKRRARTIAAYLASLGLSQDRVDASGTTNTPSGPGGSGIEMVITGDAITSPPAA